MALGGHSASEGASTNPAVWFAQYRFGPAVGLEPSDYARRFIIYTRAGGRTHGHSGLRSSHGTRKTGPKEVRTSARPACGDITALDAVCPYEVLARLPGADVKFVASTQGPQKTVTRNVALRLPPQRSASAQGSSRSTNWLKRGYAGLVPRARFAAGARRVHKLGPRSDEA